MIEIFEKVAADNNDNEAKKKMKKCECADIVKKFKIVFSLRNWYYRTFV